MTAFIPGLDTLRNGAKFDANTVRKAFLAVEAKFPVEKQDVASVDGSVIDWTGSPVLPTDIIPTQAIAAQIGGAAFINCLDILRNMVVTWKSDEELYLGPGFVLHRGLFKTQVCNDDASWMSAVAASLNIPAECPVSPGTTTGLKADTWYNVYAGLDAAGDAPDYKISETTPVICAGRGPEHPTYEKMRYLGSFRTDADGKIEAYTQYANGWVFWREIKVGPNEPTDNVAPNSTGFIDIDLKKWVPPFADCVIMNSRQGNPRWLRVKGDVVDPSGYEVNGTGGSDYGDDPAMPLPINVIDPASGIPRTDSLIQGSRWAGGAPIDFLSVAGYHVPLL